MSKPTIQQSGYCPVCHDDCQIGETCTEQECPMIVAALDAPPDPAVIAAVKLTSLLLTRAKTHPTGYGYAQSHDAAEHGLIEGDESQWSITGLGRRVLELSKGEDL